MGRARGRRLAVIALVAATSAVAAVHADAPHAGAAPVVAGPAGRYVAVGPTRLADTRSTPCGCTPVDDTTVRVDVAGDPSVPDDAVAAVLTITALPTASPSFVTAYPSGTARPPTSTVNTRTDRVVANSTIVVLGAGAVDVHTPGGGALVVDITGVFVPSTTATVGRFVSVAPTRVLDTRNSGPLPADGAVTIPLPAGVAPDATALAVNVTTFADVRPGYLRAGPAGQPVNGSSFLNTNGSGEVVAASTILPVSPAGLTLYTFGGGHVVVDLLGWFTGASAGDSADGLFVPVVPTRLRDTREEPGRIWPNGTIETPSPVAASALVTNVTVTAADWRGFVTAYPAGTTRPDTSTVNPIGFEHTVANLAITPVSTRGAAYFSLAGVDLVVDMTGYFTGQAVDAPLPPPPNQPRRPRVLLVGDSAMAALNVYTDSKQALSNFDAYYDLDNCRRLVHVSCLSPTTHRVPTTALEAIQAAPGTFDIVVMDVGHNDWNSPFFSEFDTIVNASRAKGAQVILWQTYTEANTAPEQHAAYVGNNIDLRFLTGLPQYNDVLLADWSTYSASHSRQWFFDGTHMYRPGAYGEADYLSRWVAALTHQPCVKPWSPGAVIPDPCPVPDAIGAPADPQALY